MKQILCLMLCMIIAVMAAGCTGKEGVTPSDAEPTGSVASRESAGTVSEKQTADESTADSAVAQTDASTADEAEYIPQDHPEDTASAADPGASAGQSASLAGEAAAQPKDTFGSISDLEHWLKTGEAKNNSQAEILSMMRAQNGYYYRPVISSENATWTLQKIVFASEDHWMYYYCFEPDSTAEKQSFDLYIGVAFTDFDRDFFNFKKQSVQQGKENNYLAEINGIEYAYFYHESTDSTIISWEQFDKIHTARLYGHFDQILEILPLLKLERVSYSNPGALDSE